MQFHSRANRKLIALTLFSVFTVDTYAAIYLKPGVLMPLAGGANVVAIHDQDFTRKSELSSIGIPSAAPANGPVIAKVPPAPVAELIDSAEIVKADIDGPGQPESKGFHPAGLDNMVDLFTGDFSYNIPLLDVGGYPVNLFYSGGITMDQDASWVGLGFNINPGSVTRNMRGLPDDFDGNQGDVVKKVMNVKKDISVGVNISKAIELFGAPKFKKFTPTSKVNIGVSYNNYRGVGLEAGFNPVVSIAKLVETEKTKGQKDTSVLFGALPGGLNMNLNSQSGLSVSPYINFNKLEKETGIGANASVSYNSRAGLQSIQMNFSENRNNQDPTQVQFIKAWAPALSSSISFAKPSVMPTITVPMNTFNANLSLRFGRGYKKGLLKGSPTIGGYLSISQPKDKVVTRKAFGYFNYTNASGKEDLLDFNRINDIPYQNANPVMSFPVYTYDIFSISGEGTGGSFRGYRSDIGYVRDPQQKSGSSSFTLGVGFNRADDGSGLKVDVDFEPVLTPVETGAWKKNNFAKDFLGFTKSKGTYQAVYFKNPAEKTIIDKNYFDALGGEDLVRIRMNKLAFDAQLRPQLELFTPESKYVKGILPIGSNTIRQVRDKRAQVITTLTAKEAETGGLTSKIEYYPMNVFPRGDCDPLKKTINRWDKPDPMQNRIRKSHHLSEITVLGGDGRRYIYGIPVYNYIQKDVTFNVQGNTTTGDGLVQYSDQDATDENSKGKDNYYQSEQLPSYAHSFLLSGLLSPDYVDIKGDGITEDDLGNAVKFNYSKMFYGDRDYIQWRMPFSATTNYANYSRGLLTDNSDDKAHYSYGQREQWYLNSIESKTMIATFVLDNVLRDDGKEAAGENGGANAAAGSYRLKEINLYSKAAYKVNGTNARPIKTVHFDYDYSLCPGVPNNPGGGGKLTLKKVWFSYAGNINRPYKNAYVFKYGNNKSYNRTANDRWGNYKNAANNPGTTEKLPNEQYPFVNQSIGADELAPWQLNEVLLPSGGKIKVTYESDDYGYVQNKRAATMLKVAGFGDEANGSFNNTLYTNNLIGFQDKLYVYFQAGQTLNADAATARQQISERYLADINQLYLKLYVKVPGDQYGSGYEPVGLYADIVDFGVAPDRNYFWIMTGSVNNSVSQIMETLVQSAKDNLPSKIYPGYNTKQEGSVKAMANALLGMGLEIVRTLGGFDHVFRKEKKLKEVSLDFSYGRLSQPDALKKGGGYRVKEVRIQDQWDKMTQQYNSEFGQVYDYTTTQKIAGVEKVISSGVASYEPSIGGEENPFREIMRSRLRRPLAKDQYLMQEMPVGEMFYPSAMVGYGKVRVSSIKKTNVKNGVTQQESTFYTTKDFPTISNYTSFDAGGKVRFPADPFSRIMTHYSKRADYLSQGLLVNLNDMNGNLHTQVTYADNDLKNPVNYTENIYRMDKKSETQMKLNNLVPVVKNADGKIYENELVGKDVEVMVDFREHMSKTYTNSVTDFNLEILKLSPPIIIPVLLRGVFYDESVYRSASLVKVINTYGILDSVVNIDKGSQVSTRNLIYDAETGDVLVNRTNNEFDKQVFSFTYPAHWAYKGMGPAYKNIQAVYTGIDIRDGRVVAGSIDEDVLQSGDELMVVDQSILGIPGKSVECQIVEGVGGPAPVLSNEKIIWAIDARKDPLNSNRLFLFIDRNGNLYNGKSLTVKIIRSGYRNFLGASVGSTVSQNSPVQLQGGLPYLIVNNLTNVLNAGVQEFKENWRTDTLLEKKDSIHWVINSGTNTQYNLSPINTYSLSVESKRVLIDIFNSPNWNSSVEQAFYAKAQSKRISALGINLGTRYYRTKSWQQYNFSVIPTNAFIKRAYLTLGIYRPGSSTWSHISKSPMSNVFYLSRTRHPWYPAGDNQWKTKFNNQSADFTPGNGQVMFSLPGNGVGYSNSPVINANITAMARSMKQDLALGYSSSLRISLSDAIPDKQEENKVRFKHHNEPTTNCLPDLSCTNLLVTCLTCPPGYKVDSIKQPKGFYEYICTGNDTISYCTSIFNRLRVNPYTTGMLGNWRPFRSKVYFSNRVENTISQPVYTNKGGVIADFKPYWLFNVNGLTTSTATEWVWNSEITQFNLKGAELENKDPLGRFNAGLYGYNDLLPIAVANNSRYQELAFDGFEDYSFSTQDCQAFCKKGRRLNFNNGAGITIDDSVSHTGLNSMKLNPNTTVLLDGQIKPEIQVDDYSTKIEMSSSSFTMTRVVGKGTGFLAKYYASNNFTGTPLTQIDPSLNFNWPLNSSTPQATAKSIKWDGYLQADNDGSYEFRFEFKGNITVRFNNSTVIQISNYSGIGLWNRKFSQNLVKGTIYRVEVEYKPIVYWSHSIGLTWFRIPLTSGVTIPSSLVYPPGTENLAPTAIVSQTWTCIKNNTIGGRGNYLMDRFNLIQGRKMWISAWVKEGSQDCKCSSYANPGFQVYINNSPTTATPMRATGSIIEGWQRFEGEFTIPSNVTTYSIRFINSGANIVWMDDIRIQPFNAQMKSFVYHPDNLRLMAEMDENNYATLYEYDDDGTLVRVKKETEKGVKTISESRTSLQKIITD